MSIILYFAAAINQPLVLTPEDNCGRLFTFADGPSALLKCFDKCEEGTKIFVDSGAFTVYNTGTSIDIDKYIEFINNNKRPTVWCGLDLIAYPVLNSQTALNAAEVSWNNYVYMMDHVIEDQRDKILPTFHYGEPFEALDRILNTEIHGRLCPYMCLGGRHGVPVKFLDQYYEEIFKRIKKSKNPNIKVHVLGMTVFEILERHPFYSCDSTTWLRAGMNGFVRTKVAGPISTSPMSRHRPDSFWKLPHNIADLVLEEFKQKGFTFEELSSDYKKRHQFNARFFIDWANNYEYKGHMRKVQRKSLF